MRRLCLLVLLVLTCAVPTFGQSTTVSGTITDSGGQAWFAGTIQFRFRPSDSNPSAQYFWNGAPFDKSTTIPANPLSLNGAGSFSGVSVPSNTAIAPGGSTWTVTVCPAATVPNCFSQNLTISGATQSITSQIVPPPVVVNFSVPLLGARAYADAEVVGAPPGTFYFNVTDNLIHVCIQSGFPPCTWTPMGGTAPSSNGTLYVGGTNSVFWGGGSIIAQINAAKAIAPPEGAAIYVLPQIGGGCYPADGSVETVSFSTVGQYFTLAGTTPISDSGGQIIGGSCIQDKSHSAHTLFTLDWTPTTGGAYVPGAGIRNLAILDSSTDGGTGQCNTPAGCGSSAVGVSIGGTGNSGAAAGYFENVTVQGFATNWLLQDSGGNSWGMEWNNSTFAYAGTGYSDIVGHENNMCLNCKFAANGTNISEANNGIDFSLIGGSVDSATVAGINCTGNSIIKASNVHYENLGTTNIKYMTGTCQFYSSGDTILDDTSGGTTADSFFTFTHGSMVNFTWSGGVGGRTYTGFAFNPGVALQRSHIQGFDGNTTAWSSMSNICPVSTCEPDITAQGTFSNSFKAALSHSAQSIGIASNSSIFYLRDSTNGGTAIVTVDNTTTSIVVSGAAGVTAFVAGAPGASQIGLTYSGSRFLQITGGGSTTADAISYQQTVVE